MHSITKEDQQTFNQLLKKYGLHVLVEQITASTNEQELSAREANLRCSFCGKTREQVENLIAGPNVFICTDCIGSCNKILIDLGKNKP